MSNDSAAVRDALDRGEQYCERGGAELPRHHGGHHREHRTAAGAKTSQSGRTDPDPGGLGIVARVLLPTQDLTKVETDSALPEGCGMNEQRDRVAVFRRLHASGCFVMPNPWDVGSARALEHMGFPAGHNQRRHGLDVGPPGQPRYPR
jgi:hypothetical protein